MRPLFTTIVFSICAFILYDEGLSQCEQQYVYVLGSIIEDEKGYSLTATPDGQTIYVGGIKKDSALILKMTAEGTIEWSRTFDVVPGRQDHIHKLFVDSEGMIGVAGTAGTQTGGGNVFVMRYDPDANNVLWANEYVSTSTNFCMGMIEKTDGNYLLSNNPSSPNVAELIELDKSNGAVVPAFSKHYDMGSSEAFYDFAWHNGALYASGRFSDGGSVAEMRNTLARINPADGSIAWMKLGHRREDVAARLYGFDLLIQDDFIYSIYSGDENGESIDNTRIFLQKTDLDGNLVWIKQYNFPGVNDWVDEIVYSDGGLVMLARNRVSPSDMYLFKTDTDGNITWSYVYDFFANDNATPIGSVQSQLIATESHLYFTAYAQENGAADMILVKTGLDGIVSDTCFESTSFIPQVSTVQNPDFYHKLPDITNRPPQRNILAVQAGNTTSLQSHAICSSAMGTSEIHSIMESICEGDMFEGYMETGMYTDTFQSIDGCDSIRILDLQVVSVLMDTIHQIICPGHAYEGYTDSGIYQDTFTSVSGCDSVRVLFLEVGLPTAEEEMILCAGLSFNGITRDTMYMDTLQGIPGACDTIRTLTIDFLDPVHSTYNATICEGEFYDDYDEAGTYTDTLKTEAGCDSIRTVHLAVEEPSTVTITAALCDERNDAYHQPGTYTDTLMSANGCDSIRTLVLFGSEEYIPNVFSPNEDGINDVFSIISYPLPATEVIYFAIFDRFGNMAYEVTEGEVEWNGKDKKGKYYNPGVFAYVYKYRCHQKDVVETGSITLIR